MFHMSMKKYIPYGKHDNDLFDLYYAIDKQKGTGCQNIKRNIKHALSQFSLSNNTVYNCAGNTTFGAKWQQ